jgi:hypothetical protein
MPSGVLRRGLMVFGLLEAAMLGRLLEVPNLVARHNPSRRLLRRRGWWLMCGGGVDVVQEVLGSVGLRANGVAGLPSFVWLCGGDEEGCSR